MKQKHILIVVNNIDGGIETFLQQIEKLKNTRLRFSLLSLRKEKYAKIPQFFSLGYFSFQEKKIYNLILIKSLQKFFWLNKQIKKQKPDMILSVDVHASLLVCLLKQFFFRATKIIINNRNNIRNVTKEKLPLGTHTLLRFIGFVLFSKANKIICVSKGLSGDFKKFFRLHHQSIITIYNGIDQKSATNKRKKMIKPQDQLFFQNNKQTILSIGRLEKQKDFETLIKAVNIARKKMPNIQLLIIGDGSRKKEILKSITSLGLDKNIFLLGWRKNVYPYLRHADLFVLSSHYEGFGYVLLEAMSQGIPVISTNSPFGPAEVLDKGTYGILTPVGNSEKMANHILDILNDKKTRTYYAKQSKKRVHDFSEEKMLVQYQTLIEEVVTKAHN